MNWGWKNADGEFILLRVRGLNEKGNCNAN